MFLDVSKLSFPSSNTELFERNAPLVLEIGFGDGGFLKQMAQAHPEWNFIGADLSRGSVTRAFKRLKRTSLTNIQLYHGSGLFLLRNILNHDSLTHMYVNFPDPWHKNRHADKRLLQPSFFKLLALKLVQDGVLHFTTDHAPYFDEAITFAEESGYFLVTQKPPPKHVLHTKYARKWKQSGRCFHYVHIQKHRSDAPDLPPNIHKEERMHHALLNGTIPAIHQFEKIVHRFSNGHVVILDALNVIGKDGMIFIARSHEPDLVQDLMIQLRPSDTTGSDLLLSIMNFGNPIATRGSSEAIQAITQWLIKQDLQLSSTYY
ncbi:MAG: tRNA (guanosine(46)-N7)-methyltransferase TrmB [Bacteroidetes bacterium]|nr:tRNA (guanosine(46)-N7)-methyltransferase TrmB [Bacteroidota bacterium]